jgi:hypothetical protein
MRRSLKARVHAIVRSIRRDQIAPIDTTPPDTSVPFVDRQPRRPADEDNATDPPKERDDHARSRR